MKGAVIRSGHLIQMGEGAVQIEKEIRETTPPLDREWEKVRVLSRHPDYMEFLSRLSGLAELSLREILNQFYQDAQFKEAFGPRLSEFEGSADFVHGDLRFHSLTLYCCVRALTPGWVVETGVASGKSSALILLGLHHNRRGRLLSIDLPNPPGRRLADGAVTHTGRKEPGWLVPEYLKGRWRLQLGDARQLLPAVLKEIPTVDLFFHDSLHTPEHVRFELETIAPHLKRGSLVLVDDVDLSGNAFSSFLEQRSVPGYAYRDLAGVRLPSI